MRFSTLRASIDIDAALISTLRNSAFLCASAVKRWQKQITAETQRNAELRREENFNLGHYAAFFTCRFTLPVIRLINSTSSGR